ncbi:MAG: metal-dependent hydrolase [Hyphomicrobiaceae bacterium]|nr:metal-dependent hydrolase [Hyphomicrobiaceae bacterium]
MANYATHIAAGTVVSGALATLTLAADVIGPESLVAVTLAGVVGSILPDIDLRDSRASSVLFSGIGVFASFCVLFLCAPHFSVVELWVLWLGTLVFVRYGLHAVFHHLAVHRGIWHSLLAAVFCGALTIVVFKEVLGQHAGVAWLGGGFMVVGYLVHLLLDEMYSVDFMGNRIKQSFGTALKLYDGSRPATTLAMLAATGLVIMATPSPQPFFAALGSRDLWTGLNHKLLPQGRWFGGVTDRLGFGAANRQIPLADEAKDSDIVTGAIPLPKSDIRDEKRNDVQ